MAYEVTLPRLGWDMEEGALGGWLKKDGEFVNAGELLFAVEGDKAVQEIEALDSGYLRIAPQAPAQGEKVPVGTLLGYLVPEAELASFRLPGAPGVATPVMAAVQPAMPAAALQQAAEPAVATSSDGHTARRVYISPYARRLAEGMGVAWQRIAGSGRGGRIMARDVQNAAVTIPPVRVTAPAAVATAPAFTPAAMPASAQPAAIPASGRAPMTAVRRNIAEHMARSAHTAAPVTLTCEVDATQLVALRRQLKDDYQAENQPAPSYNDMLAKIAAHALMEHPEINAHIDGDDIVYSTSAHVGVAVDSERGLLVPVLRDVQAKSLRQVTRETATLIEKARRGAAGYDELQGGTFTITNLGMFEIEAFTPIIHLPQCAILGVGQIIPKLVVIDAEREQTAIQQRMALSLTFDHRLVDGAQAARFLQRIKRLIEKPYIWLAG
jgi:pyruvate dehydrogenase E2 component (dihydrolipoamide acetyltransferase)